MYCRRRRDGCLKARFPQCVQPQTLAPVTLTVLLYPMSFSLELPGRKGREPLQQMLYEKVQVYHRPYQDPIYKSGLKHNKGVEVNRNRKRNIQFLLAGEHSHLELRIFLLKYRHRCPAQIFSQLCLVKPSWLSNKAI